MSKVSREKQIDSKALALPDKIRRKKVVGKNEKETVEVTLTGGKTVDSLVLNHRKLKLTKADSEDLSNEIVAAVNQAIKKHQLFVEREIEKI